jgi:Protein of unknown function (DUF402)
MTEYWSPGTQIQWIYLGRRHGVHNVRPMTVVEHDEHRLVAWLAGGTPLVKPVLPDGREVRTAGLHEIFVGPRVAELAVWHGTGVLKVSPAGRPWSIWHFWRPGGSFSGWYVNLETPHERDLAARTTTTEDLVLDLWVTPDRSVRRKDEDELAMALKVGKYDEARVAEIEGYADAAEREITRWGPPFNEDWRHWRPDPTWPLPPAPTGYDIRYVAAELRG